MSSMVGAIQTRASQSSDLGRHLAAAIWFSILLLGASVAVLFTSRRIAGALSDPLSGIQLVAAAITILVCAAALRRIAPGRMETTAEFSLPGIAAFLLLAAVTLPGTPGWGIASAWLLFIAGESGAWLVFHPPRAVLRRLRREGTTDGEEQTGIVDEPALPPGLVQQMTRVRDGDHESIHALFETRVPAGDHRGIAHLAFCPPLVSQPELTAHAVDCEDAEVRVTQIETFGARFEVRFTQPSEESRRVIVEAIGSITVPTES
jgi:hypothetical protein